MKRRTFLMSGSAALLAASQALADSQEEGMVLRRMMDPGEDPEFFRYGQHGNFLPASKPAVISFDRLRVVVHYPRYTHRARLVVFSHGALADPQIYRLLISHWVSHGFVVAAPIHDDSPFERGLLARRSSLTGPSVWEIDRVLNDVRAWQERRDACTVPLDYYLQLGETIGLIVDIERPIIIGHEFGAFLVQLLLGTRVRENDGEFESFSDPRFSSGLAMSPQGVGIMGLTEQSWQDVTRPLMMVQGAGESDFTMQEPQDRISGFSLSPANNKHLAWFTKGDRLLYAGPRSGVNTESQRQFEHLKATTAAFLDAYGNYNVDTFNNLAGDWIDLATDSEVLTRYR